MKQLFYNLVEYCASHPWKVMATFLLIAICVLAEQNLLIGLVCGLTIRLMLVDNQNATMSDMSEKAQNANSLIEETSDDYSLSDSEDMTPTISISNFDDGAFDGLPCCSSKSATPSKAELMSLVNSLNDRTWLDRDTSMDYKC